MTPPTLNEYTTQKTSSIDPTFMILQLRHMTFNAQSLKKIHSGRETGLIDTGPLYFLVQEIFPAGMSVVLFSRLYMSCAPFFLPFGYIWIENGMIGFYSLCRLLARVKVFFQARIDLTRPEYGRKLIVTLYVAFSSSYV